MLVSSHHPFVRVRAGLVGLSLLATVAAVAMPPGLASAQGGARQITYCGSEFGPGGTQGRPTGGSVAYAVASGGTWTFTCSGTIPFVSALDVPSGRAVSLLVGSSEAVALDGGAAVRLFTVEGNLTLTGPNLTLQNGSENGGGGAIFNDGTLTASDTAFDGSNSYQSPLIGGAGPGGAGGAIYNEGTLVVDGDTFAGNSATDNGIGGAIYNSHGTVTVTSSTFSGNAALGALVGTGGGAILNFGTMVVIDSTFSTNSSPNGGALFNDNGSPLTVIDSTFAGNTSSGGQGGAAIYNGGPLTVRGDTFVDNSTDGNGGALFSNTTSTSIANSTFTGNSAVRGGAIFNGAFNFASVVSSTLSGNSASGGGANLDGNGGTVKNTILANPVHGTNCAELQGSPPFAVVDSLESDTSCGTPSSGGWIVGDPALGALASNGGATETMALGSGSAALGVGDPAVCATAPVFGFDQRGFARSASACDIGAYEATPPPALNPEVPTYGFSQTPMAPAGSLAAGATVSVTVYAETYGGARVPYAPLGLAFAGSGSATVATTSLAATPQSLVTDSAGQVAVTYTAGSLPPAGDVDMVTASGPTAGGLLPVSDGYAYAPHLTSVVPAAAAPGSALTLTGEGFGSVAGSVYFTQGGVTLTQSGSQVTWSDLSVGTTVPAGLAAGSVSVSLYSPASGLLSNAQTLTVLATPTVTGISPPDGPTAGGTAVTVSGSGFEAGGQSVVQAVYFGATPAAGFTVASGSSLVAVSPPGQAGTVDVTATAEGVTSAAGTSDRFTYLAPSPAAPVLASVSPSSGPVGTQVLLTGSGFGTVAGSVYWIRGGTTLRQTPAGSSWSGGAITTTVPPGLAVGAVSVAVYSPSASSGALSFHVTASAGGGASGGGGVPAVPVTDTVGSAGGTLVTADGACSVTIPADAIAPGATVMLTDSGVAPPGIPSGLVAASPVCELTGAALAPAVAITIAYHASATQALSVYAQPDTGGGWTFSPTAVDAAQGTAAAYTAGAESLVVLANPRAFPDLPASYPAAASIDAMLGADLMQGFPDGTLQPDADLTRAQLAKMLVLALRLPVGSGATAFRDVPADAWFAPYVAAGAQSGIVDGTSPGAFDPGGIVTREQMAVMLARALHLSAQSTLSFTDAAQIAGWAQAGVQAVVAAGYLQGFPDGSFQPLDPTTRAQAARVLALVIQHMAP